MTNEEAKCYIRTLLEVGGCDGFDYKQKEALDKAIKALETTCIEDYPTCTECEHYDKEKHYCPRFCQVIKDTLAEAHPCEDCISKKDTIEWLKKVTVTDGIEFKTGFEQILYDIEQMPPVTPQRQKGKWIFREDMGHQYCCSECGCPKPFVNDYYYKKIIGCPYCLADMSGGEEGETDN